MRKINLPPHVEDAISMLERKGFEAYVVGGAVRDALLGIDPTDWDITTNALPDEIKNTFEKHFDTGIKHGTVTALVRGLPIEITTYRVDGEYTDSRHPEKVTFTKNLYDDLRRRDFTINALAYNAKTGIVDTYGGLDDLKFGIIRCIGNPKERFNEDALRILRALRFSATLKFDIDNLTYEAVCTNAHMLKYVSGERVCSELTKLIMADKHIEKLFDSGVGDVILPELSCCFSIWQNNSIQIFDVGNHTLEVLYKTPKTPVLRYAALLHDIGKAKTKQTDRWGIDSFPGHEAVSASMAREILTRLKMSNKSKLAIVNLIRMHGVNIKPTDAGVRRAMANMGRAEFIDLIYLKRANTYGHNIKCYDEKLGELYEIEIIYNNAILKNCPLHIKELAVNGNDMKEIGLSGTRIGRMLRLLLACVIENPLLNNREKLMEIAIKIEKGEK